MDNFKLSTNGTELMGYSWPVESPHHVVVLVHGIGEHAGRYDRMAGYFREAGIALVSMDLRGHGMSPGKRGHTAPRTQVLEDIDHLIDYARNKYPDVPVVLYGHSMGGNLVLDYRRRGTLSYVPAGYIISAPWVKLVRAVPKALVGALGAAAKLTPQLQLSSAVDEETLGNPLYVRPYTSSKLVHNKITIKCATECYAVGDALYAGTLHGNDLGAEKPTLLMHGSGDMICDVEGSRQIAKLEPNIEYVEWPGYFHEIHNGNQTETGEEVILKAIDFIKNLK